MQSIKSYMIMALLSSLWGPADSSDPPFKMTPEEQIILEMTNAERAKEKLPPLAPNSVLIQIARGHSANMAMKGEMQHVLDGKTPAQRTLAGGYDYRRVAENIAEFEYGRPPEDKNKTDLTALKEVMKGWMESPEHRKNILGRGYEEVGLGIGRTDKGKLYFTQLFATPRKKKG
jgi:uncharacterized protein YkwD